MPSGAPPDSNPDLPRTLREPCGTWHDPGVTIRTLTLADLPACLALAADRDWQPEAHKWRLLIEGGEAFGIDDEDGGGLAGSVVLTRYGDALAAVGMMLVAARREGRGLGRRLMTHLLDRAGDATVFLTATPLGRPLYEKLAFRPIGTLTTHTGRSPAARPASRAPRSRRTSPAILALDAAGLRRRPLRPAAALPRAGGARPRRRARRRVAAYGAALRNTVQHVARPGHRRATPGSWPTSPPATTATCGSISTTASATCIAFARGAGLSPGLGHADGARRACAAWRPCARDRADDDGRRVTITPARQSAPPSSASTGGVSPRIAQPSSTATGGTR